MSTSISPGPVFAERAQTLGRGRALIGANVNRLHFETLRGVDLDEIRLNFTHENVDSPQCDSLAGADCAVLTTAGFDHLLAPWATLAVDLVAELQASENKLQLPGTVVYEVPFLRTVEPTTIPNQRDDQANATFGVKFTTHAGMTVVLNSVWPLNRGDCDRTCCGRVGWSTIFDGDRSPPNPKPG